MAIMKAAALCCALVGITVQAYAGPAAIGHEHDASCSGADIQACLADASARMRLIVATQRALPAPQLPRTADAAEAGKEPSKYSVGDSLNLIQGIIDSLDSNYFRAKPHPGFGITREDVASRTAAADQALAEILAERARRYTPAGVPSQKITPADIKRLRQVAADIGLHFIHLIAIMDCETGRQYNTGAYPLGRERIPWVRGKTVGLIQWTPAGSSINQLPGESQELTLNRLAGLSFSAQLDEVKKYLLAIRPRGGQVPETLLSAYMSVFGGALTSDVSKTIYSATATPEAYNANRSLDGCQPGTRPDGKITAAELLWRVKNHGLEIGKAIADGFQKRGLAL